MKQNKLFIISICIIAVILAVLISSKIIRDSKQKPASGGVFVIEGEIYEYLT